MNSSAVLWSLHRPFRNPGLAFSWLKGHLASIRKLALACKKIYVERKCVHLTEIIGVSECVCVLSVGVSIVPPVVFSDVCHY